MQFKIYKDSDNGVHTRFRLFSGRREGCLGLAGQLCMRTQEFKAFVGLLEPHRVENDQGFDSECFGLYGEPEET